MALEVENKKHMEPMVIEIMEFDNLESILSKIVIPFSEFINKDQSPDIYNGQEKIPFEKRYSEFQNILSSEFENAMHEYQVDQIKEFIL